MVVIVRKLIDLVYHGLGHYANVAKLVPYLGVFYN